MLGFEPRISGGRINRFTIWATTTAQRLGMELKIKEDMSTTEWLWSKSAGTRTVQFTFALTKTFWVETFGEKEIEDVWQQLTRIKFATIQKKNLSNKKWFQNFESAAAEASTVAEN